MSKLAEFMQNRSLEHDAAVNGVITTKRDVTGHPAMSVPCGMSNGLPIGMQLVGKHWDESTIYRAAHAFEQAGDWRNF